MALRLGAIFPGCRGVQQLGWVVCGRALVACLASALGRALRVATLVAALVACLASALGRALRVGALGTTCVYGCKVGMG